MTLQLSNYDYRAYKYRKSRIYFYQIIRTKTRMTRQNIPRLYTFFEHLNALAGAAAQHEAVLEIICKGLSSRIFEKVDIFFKNEVGRLSILVRDAGSAPFQNVK